MKSISFDYKEIPHISDRDLSFIKKKKSLLPFIADWAEIKSFERIMQAKAKQKVDRKTLVAALKTQYKQVNTSKATEANIKALSKSNCFTVTTAHQPSLLTGPLYFIYKICSTINLTNQLNKAYPKKRFVPIFVSGGEDHDFDEINHLHMFNKTFTWDRHSAGAVGRMSVKGVAEVINQVSELVQNADFGPQIIQLFNDALASSKSYAEFTFAMVNELFKEHGLVFLNMDQASLKSLFVPFIKKELEEQQSKVLIEETVKKLVKAGYSGQAHAREINLFYLGDGFRERIVFEKGKYKVLNTKLSFTPEEILVEVEKSPESFSPNVVMRPIYQEVILPNLAYIGGGGEIAYWTERKTHFEYFGVPFPLLIRRNSAMMVNGGMIKQLEKTPFTLNQFFQDEQSLISLFLKDHIEEDIDIKQEMSKVSDIFDIISKKAGLIQQPLSKTVLAEKAKQLKTLGHLESKLKKAAKDKNEVKLNQIKKLRSKIFPNNSLQERYENFIPYYTRYGSDWIDYLIKVFDPLQDKFMIVLTDDN